MERLCGSSITRRGQLGAHHLVALGGLSSAQPQAEAHWQPARRRELPTRISKLVSLSWQQSGLLYSRTIQTYTVFSKSIMSHGLSVICEMNPRFCMVVIPSTTRNPPYAELSTLRKFVRGQPPALHVRAKFIAGNVRSGQSGEHAPQVMLVDTDVKVSA